MLLILLSKSFRLFLNMKEMVMKNMVFTKLKKIVKRRRPIHPTKMTTRI